MSDFLEDHLTQVLQRQNAPEGFTERVLARVPVRRMGLPSAWYWAIAAALVCVLLYGAIGHSRQQQAQQTLTARVTERQVVFALTLALEKVQHVNARLQQTAPRMMVEKRGEKL